MGTREIKEHLRERLKGVYSEEELDLIARTLEEDPPWDPALYGFPGLDPITTTGRRLTPEETRRVRGLGRFFAKDPRLLGAWDPTGTVITQQSNTFYAHSDGHNPPWEFVEFHITASEMEELAQAMARQMREQELNPFDLPDILGGKK